MSDGCKFIEGYFTSAGVAKFINLPFLPQSMEFLNKTKWATDTNHLVKLAFGFQEDAAGTAYCIVGDGSAHDTNATITAGGFSFISAGTYAFGPTIALAATFVTKAAPAVVTTASAHGLATGDVVWLYGTTAMRQIAGQPYEVKVLSTTTFSIPVDSSGFANAASAGFMKKLLYPDLYIPYGAQITACTTGASTVITCATNPNIVVGQEVQLVNLNFINGSTTAWGLNQINNLTGYVTAVASDSTLGGTNNKLTININSTGATAFAFPTDAQAALGMSFPYVMPIGDANSGYTGPSVPQPQTIPGAFAANTRQGVLIGVGDGTTIMHATSDVCRWRAYLPDALFTS